ncbi:hypothetical protein KMP11_03020 [Gemella sp. zg-570]|uniref:hypothetical protein n=1 Tax=Gemella sp. zg-570 TaxID=2840371 RepID=UPI001C0B1968|nr:hypothetical protein [Gemella sp. zg-570]QWQ39313.1 hypothetical protein KMP11_03020 [Gemella sp. zg-570]
MSLMYNLQPASVLTFKETVSKSGAKSKEWVEDREIKLSLNSVSELYFADDFKRSEVSHIALTFDKSLSSRNNRLKIGGRVFEIVSCSSEHRLSFLSLKEYVYNG